MPYRSWLEVSRERIASNFHAVRAAVGSQAEVVPVVRADACGHGAVEVSRVLADQGARWLAVSNVEEGRVLRMAGIRTRILVMADFRPSVREAPLEFDLTPVIGTLTDLREWSRMSERSGALLRYHLEVDSGMVRQGTRAGAEEIAKAVLENRGAALEGLMTQFASLADCSSAQTSEQIVMFERLRRDLAGAGIRPSYVHLASTTPVACALREAWGNMVRADLAIYGYLSPTRGEAHASELRVEPALSWKARVLAVQELQVGAPVGYGGT